MSTALLLGLLPLAALEPPAQPLLGQVVLNLEPSATNPRNSEGSFATLRDGRLLFVYTQFQGGADDHSGARLAGVESSDGGLTWSAPREVLANEGGANVMSVSLLRLASGRLAMFYLRKNSMLDCRPYVRYSDDEAATWSEPTLVIAAPGYFVLNNDRVVQLVSGRLIVPVSYHRNRAENPMAGSSLDMRGLLLWYLSDDEGNTWREARTWWALPVHSGAGLQEPGVVQLPDGSLYGWARTDQGCQYELRSVDQGESWSAPQQSPLRSPTSPASIVRLADRRLLAVWNDHSGHYSYPAGKRTPLAVALSADGARTWSEPKLLENDPDGWYCYTAITPVADHLLLAYCAGDSKVGGLNRLRLRRVALSELG